MLWTDSIWALWFLACFYTVLDASIPVFWASVGDFFGRKSFGTIHGNMNLFYTWGAILGPYAAGVVYDRTESYALVFSAITIALIISAALTALLIACYLRIQKFLPPSKSRACRRGAKAPSLRKFNR